jgi:hypothetical protein
MRISVSGETTHFRGALSFVCVQALLAAEANADEQTPHPTSSSSAIQDSSTLKKSQPSRGEVAFESVSLPRGGSSSGLLQKVSRYREIVTREVTEVHHSYAHLLFRFAVQAATVLHLLARVNTPLTKLLHFSKRTKVCSYDS